MKEDKKLGYRKQELQHKGNVKKILRIMIMGGAET